MRVHVIHIVLLRLTTMMCTCSTLVMNQQSCYLSPDWFQVLKLLRISYQLVESWEYPSRYLSGGSAPRNQISIKLSDLKMGILLLFRVRTHAKSHATPIMSIPAVWQTARPRRPIRTGPKSSPTTLPSSWVLTETTKSRWDEPTNCWGASRRTCTRWGGRGEWRRGDVTLLLTVRVMMMMMLVFAGGDLPDGG